MARKVVKPKTWTFLGRPHTDAMCPKCEDHMGELRAEMLMPLPVCGPISKFSSDHICFDCAAAESYMRDTGGNFLMARIATGNDRQEKLRLPGLKATDYGLPLVPGAQEGDLEAVQAWQKRKLLVGGAD